jgi:hypothetical protein
MGEYRWWNPGVKEVGVIKVKIVGISSTGAPLIGRTYIVELPSWVKFGTEYDYTHVTAFECHLHEKHPFGADHGELAHYLECPWCGYKRHRISKPGGNEVTLRCGNTKCERIGIITLAAWKKIEKCQ